MDVFVEFLSFVAQAAPELLKDIEALVADFKQGHPNLGAAPPPDGEAKVDEAVDAEARKRADLP